MRRRALAILFLFLFGGASLAYLGGFRLPSPDPAAPAPARRATAVPDDSKIIGDVVEALKPASPQTVGELRFDVARLDPQGISVFAGQAPPDSQVTVLADGRAVGTAKADENGEWTLVAEKGVTNKDAKLTLRMGEPEREVAASASKETTSMAAARPPTAQGKERPDEKPASGSVASRLVDDLERLVVEARKEEAARTGVSDNDEMKPNAATPSSGKAPPAPAPTASPSSPPAVTVAPPPPVSPSPTVPRTTATAAIAPPQAKIDAPAEVRSSAPAPIPLAPAATVPNRVAAIPAGTVTSIPIPITFLYNETTFTPDGARAAGLLLEYLKLKRYQSVSLSGHADERGSVPFNVALSRERLDAVALFLRGGGYSGSLDLIPKGESEPFSTIDRARLAADDLHQLDRRVELRLTN